MAIFSEETFREKYDFSKLDESVLSAARLASQNPVMLYLFFQRYSYFNGYASASVARLASSIGLSRYLFSNSELLVTEEADRGMEISAKVMTAAADEGANDSPVHRALAQLTVKTVGDYAGLSADERNALSPVPMWLREISEAVIANYQGIPGDVASLVKAMGFHLASEMLGDQEYTLLDMVIRHENRDVGFDAYLRNEAKPVKIGSHRYTPWSWILIHSQYGGSGVEVEHFECGLDALNLAARFRSESEAQMKSWALEGFGEFVELQQRMFRELYQECLATQAATAMPEVSVPETAMSPAAMNALLGV